ncbi:hypothetical protein NIES4071_73170 [Calothrix sp. NIES-4071]|nr:hypothetical protein NIES4071_73170 [Calothrix sp. NIES-4071]BAZ61592.1 hypothetical protein NIES4105_73120 [Calothrix sp. NIES-4105]
MFIVARRHFPQEWLNNLSQWKVSFINELINLPVERISLPHLFLCLLKHFFPMFSLKDAEYNPYQYKEIIYYKNNLHNPLKIYHPLNTIEYFCDTLKIIWDSRHKSNLGEFKIFQFNGRGLLKGKRSQTDKTKKTILAYCGGWIEGKGKCGFAPLIIGKHENYPTCNYLICKGKNCDCDYCSRDCPSYLDRKRKQKTNMNSININYDDDIFF